MTDAPAPSLHASTGATSLRDDAEAALRRLVGRDDARLRADQWTAIEALVARQARALVVQRTGWGKSAVYFVATRLLRDAGAGPTVIVSPLLALMRDQISAAARAGIRAVTVNSANVTEWDQVHAAIAAGEVDVLLCSPERLNNPQFRDEVLPRLAADAGLVVVDEAHCISDWGHDFRPDYRRIRTLLADLPVGIPVLATTATANARVTTDVAEQLGVTGGGSPADVMVLRGALDRESLHLAVLDLPDPAARVAWLVQSLGSMTGSGIVYCLTVSAAEELASQLRAAGLEVGAYTGRTDPAERERLEQDLKENRVKALVATSALGMGFDKPDLAFVVHLGAPSSPIAYYQQVGRAGRGVDRAVVALLPGREDCAIWDWFGSQAFPEEDTVRTTLAALDPERPTSIPTLESTVDLSRSRLEAMLKVLDVDGAVRRVSGGWLATGRPWEYDAARYARVQQARLAEQRTMVAYQQARTCRMAFLRRSLDDPELDDGWTCGRCDVCGGVALPQAPTAEAVAAARTGLDRVGTEIVPRRQWPSGMESLGVSLRGRIPADEMAETGRAIARLDGLGWSGALRDMFAARGEDGAPVDEETPVSLRHAAARVLDEWEQRGRLDGVVGVASTTRPRMNTHLVNGLARYLGVPVLGWVTPAAGREEPMRHDVNSAQRLAGVVGRLRLAPEPGAELAQARVLMVDDSTDSGWTLTVAAREVRLAGAAAVLPFVLGVR
ncbi:RecQ family ATP-dependent DNA helicase [Demequina capsici]|uniref:DNA 3'-5' helicase n=1 Tax=Demequina capsici TaxID=3075620 RepID=A0AA96F4H9_9MICO|nr:RecQ family ATP-dependent DNA helicase [Demequina sp. OYTSA14]WNM23329.1 RecQ family ATP-dependent DNA helicase [Demequina sp. OYTSA14]